MEEERARRVVDTLRARNVFAHVKLPQAGITQYGIRVVLPDGREAIWDNDGTAGLEAHRRVELQALRLVRGEQRDSRLVRAGLPGDPLGVQPGDDLGAAPGRAQ